MSEKTKDSLIAVAIIAGGAADVILNYALYRDVSPYGIGTAAVGVLLLILAHHPRS